MHMPFFAVLVDAFLYGSFLIPTFANGEEKSRNSSRYGLGVGLELGARHGARQAPLGHVIGCVWSRSRW